MSCVTGRVMMVMVVQFVGTGGIGIIWGGINAEQRWHPPVATQLASSAPEEGNGSDRDDRQRAKQQNEEK
jgi:hypothetical protein